MRCGRPSCAPSLAAMALALVLARSVDAAPASKTELEAARSAFADGLALEGQSRWAEALERFERAAAVRTSAQVRFHLGLCFEHTGRLVDALDAFLGAQRDAVGDASARRTGELAGRHVASLRKRVASLVLHAPRNHDDVETSVTLDGHALQAAVFDVPLPIDPGEHVVVASCPGHAATEERIVAHDAERLELSVRIGAELAPSSVAPPPPPSTAPSASPPSVAGVRAPSMPPVSAAMTPSRRWPVAPVVVGGFAVASFAAMGVFYGIRGAAIADLREGCAGRDACPDELRGVRDRGHAFTVAGNVALGVGLTAGVVAVVSFLIWKPSRTPDVAVVFRGPRIAVDGAF